MHWLSNLLPGEEFGLPDALCTNAVLHVILFNMNKSLIYQKSVPRMCVPSVTCQKTLYQIYMIMMVVGRKVTVVKILIIFLLIGFFSSSL